MVRNLLPLTLALSLRPLSSPLFLLLLEQVDPLPTQVDKERMERKLVAFRLLTVMAVLKMLAVRESLSQLQSGPCVACLRLS